MSHGARTLCRQRHAWTRVRDVDEILDKVHFSQNSNSRPNPPSIRIEDSNGTLDFRKFQIKV